MRRLLPPAALVLILAGCGGGGSNDNKAVTSASVASADSTPSFAGDPSSSSVAAAPSSAGGGDSTAVCTFLNAEAAKLTAGTAVGNLAKLAIDLATFVGDHPDARVTDTSELDRITTKSCPDARRAVLQKIGAQQFAGSL